MSSTAPQIVQANGVDVCVQTFGDPGSPAVFLIMGSSASMDWWEDGFCERLAAGGRFVIRYDHRDTGQSVTYPPGEPGYDLQDLLDDALDLLDHFELPRAHVVGMSMGSAIAQQLAVHHPDRVQSLTLIASAPAAPGPDDPDLPSMSDDTRAAFGALEPPDWSDRAAVVEYLVEFARILSARSVPFDEDEVRQLARRALARSQNIESTMTNHNAIDGFERMRERLADLATPTLIVHGTEDPLIPYGNALALDREVPTTHLVPLEATGHEIPRRTWDTLIPALLEHTGRE